MVPLTLPGGNPVTELPGESPISPVTWVSPVLVTVLAARIANSSAAPRFTAFWGVAAKRFVAVRQRVNAVQRRNELNFVIWSFLFSMVRFEWLDWAAFAQRIFACQISPGEIGPTHL
jgi:hypothetical protein